jgi:integrase
LTLSSLIDIYLEDYELRQFSTVDTARGRVAHLASLLGKQRPTAEITASEIRQYQISRRREGASAATINRETSALNRMFRLAFELGWIPTLLTFPARLRENGPRQGFFEHADYLAVRSHLPASYQDVLDFAYYSGWRKREILGLRWDEIDAAAKVIRLPPHRSKTRTGRLLPISKPLSAVLASRRAKRNGNDPLVFRRDDVTVRGWRRAWPEACRAAGVPGRLLHDCRRTTARNLIRAGIPERVAMTLTGHKTRSVFDRYNIVNERELFDAGEKLSQYLEERA